MQAVLVSLCKRALVLVAMLCLGCAAQNPISEINQRIARQVRSSAQLSPGAEIKVGERKSSDFGGWEEVQVTVKDQGAEKVYTFLLAKDGNTLVHYNKFDLSTDPNARIMAKIDISGRPVRGPKDAKVTMVVYDDYQCPYCARMYATLFSEALRGYRNAVKIVYKDYPLYEIHPWAIRAAVNANCLAGQSGDAYWDFNDYVHGHQQELSAQEGRPAAPKKADKGAKEGPPARRKDAGLDQVALDIGAQRKLDLAKLEACMAQRNTDAIRASMTEAQGLGVSATPTLFINGERLEGAVSAEELRAVLDRALREAGVPVPAAPAKARGTAAPGGGDTPRK